MSYKKNIQKIIMFSLILLAFIPGILTPIIGLNKHESNHNLATAFDEVHKGFMYKSETLEAFGGADSYQLELKAGKTYYFSIKFDNTVGWSLFVTLIGSPGYVDVGAWDANDPVNMRKIMFLFTPDTTQNHTLIILKSAPFDNVETEYTVYVNRQGFAGIWWMILIGVGALVIIILLIALVVRVVKPKKRKRRK